MVKLVMHTFPVIDPPENLEALGSSASRINETHQMQSKAWTGMKWMAENCALIMPDMNVQQLNHVIREILEDAAHDQDLEIDVDQDHVIVEDLVHDPAVEVGDQEVVQEDGVETEEADQNLIDLVHVTENLDHVTEASHADAIAVGHVISPDHDLVQDNPNVANRHPA